MKNLLEKYNEEEDPLKSPPIIKAKSINNIKKKLVSIEKNQNSNLNKKEEVIQKKKELKKLINNNDSKILNQKIKEEEISNKENLKNKPILTNTEEEDDPLKNTKLINDYFYEENEAYTITFNYNYLTSKNTNFILLSKKNRASLLEDIFILDRLYYEKKLNQKLTKNSKNEDKSIFKSLNKKFDSYKSENWKYDILNSIKNKEKKEIIKNKISLIITHTGIPQAHRKAIWKYFIGNDLRINQKIFQIYLKRSPLTISQDKQIQQDIDRTFYYYIKNKDFKKILSEAKLLLHIFTLYRPDIKYVQGMSYPMVMLLFHYKPYRAFKLFTNLVLSRSILYKTYLFKREFMESVYGCLENIVFFYYNELYQYFKSHKLDIWNIFWIEWIYALFLRTFRLETCFVIWDLIIVLGERVIFKLVYVVFGVIMIHFEEINKNNFYEDVKILLIKHQEDILYSLINSDIRVEDDVECVGNLLINL